MEKQVVELLGSDEGIPVAGLYDPASGEYLVPVVDAALLSRLRTAVQELADRRPVVAIIDTGVLPEHPWIKDMLADALDVTGEGPYDEHGHGTMVALKYLSVYRGPVRMLSVKAIGRTGRSTERLLVQGIGLAVKWLLAQNSSPPGGLAGFINISAGINHRKWWRKDCRGDCALCRAAEAAVLAGVWVDAAAGNEPGVTYCPARLALVKPNLGVSAVGALDDEQKRPAAYSGIGTEYWPGTVWFQRAAQPSNPAEESKTGVTAALEGKTTIAETLLRRSMAAGYATAEYDLGVLLGRLGRVDEEIAAYEEFVRRFGDASEPAVREAVANALSNKAVRLGQLRRAGDEQIAAYEEIVRRFGDASEPPLREAVARALFNKGVKLGELGRSDEEIEAYEEIERRLGAASAPTLREAMANALFNKGVKLGQLGRSDEEIAAYEEIERRSGNASDPTQREQVIKALLTKGVRLGQLGRLDEAIAAYEDIERRLVDASEPTLLDAVAEALLNKGATLGELGRSDEEIAAYKEVERRFGDSSEPRLQRQVAKALLNKGITLDNLSRWGEEIAAYDAVERRFGGDQEPTLREPVARALFSKGVSLGQLGRAVDAIDVYDEIERRFGGDSEPALRELVAKALVNRGFSLGELGRSDEAIAVYEEVERRFGGDSEPALGELVAKALVNRARLRR